jgi:hypothetical protein
MGAAMARCFALDMHVENFSLKSWRHKSKALRQHADIALL